jgi:hypothetical protein
MFFCVVAASLGAATSDAQATLYERIETLLKKDPALAARLSRAPAELEKVLWMVGTWEITSLVFATRTTPERISAGTSVVAPVLDGTWLSITDSYASSVEDIGYLGYEADTGRWVTLSLGSTSFVYISYAAGWRENKLEFRGPPVHLLGMDVTLRQTLQKRSDREYRVLNEELLANGRWVAVDEYVYRKK